MVDEIKLSLPNFLKVLTGHSSLTMPKAMAVASKIYKECNTPSLLAQLTEAKLVNLGVDEKDTRKQVMQAVRGAGYAKKRKRVTAAEPSGSQLPETSTEISKPKSKRKRTIDDDKNELLPDRPPEEETISGSLDFGEVHDEEVLITRSTVVNRAPIMAAWATVVAERMGFCREEALSIASVYTESNAISKGVSLGIYPKGKEKDRDASENGMQPYVELMGRRIPLYRSQVDQWRALTNNVPAPPNSAFSYITRSLRQTTPYIIGALRLLAESYTPEEINAKGWYLYADFRPSVDGWGKRSTVHCETILSLRKKTPISATAPPAVRSTAAVIQYAEKSELLEADIEREDKRLKLASRDSGEGEVERKNSK